MRTKNFIVAIFLSIMTTSGFTQSIDPAKIEPVFLASPSSYFSNVDVLKELTVIEAKTRILRKEADGKFTAIFGKILGKDVSLVFIQDLMVYKPEVRNGKIERIGAMIRIRADFKTKEANIELSNILSLAANASKVEGTVQFISYGFTGKGVLTLVPLPPVGITESSLSDCLQALNVIRGKVGDTDVEIKPMTLPDIE